MPVDNNRIKGIRSFLVDAELALIQNKTSTLAGQGRDTSNVHYDDRAIVLDEDDALITAKIADRSVKYLFIVTKLAQCIKFEIEKTREQGRSTRGVRGIKFKHDSDEVVDANIIANDEQEILVVSEEKVGALRMP